MLATLTVIAAILPMAFVGGLNGPYLRPIPVGASAAMVFSLLVAFVVTPWAAARLLGSRRPSGHAGARPREPRHPRLPLAHVPARRPPGLALVVPGPDRACSSSERWPSSRPGGCG